MPQYVIFRLAAPMASYGDIAVGERRPTADRPSRSAVMGILAAALGIDRHDDAGQASLSDACKVAVRVERTGRLMVDFHTVQTPRSSKQPYATRADELRADRVETILSRREYRTDVLATVAIEVSDASTRTADEISEALRNPRYALYVGRRSCPLSLPLAPICIEASDVLEALQGVRRTGESGSQGVQASPMAGCKASACRSPGWNAAGEPCRDPAGDPTRFGRQPPPASVRSARGDCPSYRGS